MTSNRAKGSTSSGLRIVAFPTSMNEANVNNIWLQLKSAIIEIQNKNNSGLSFEELYRNAYTLVLQRHGGKLYTNTEGVVRSHMNEIKSGILDNINNDFLNYLNTAWKDHQTAMVMIRDILMYMDRVYVVQNSLIPVYNNGMNLFVSIILDNNQIRMTLVDTLLEMIKKERNGEFIPRMKVRDATQMFVQLGVGKLNVYQNYFENALIAQTREFYAGEARSLLAEGVSAPYFINKVEQRIEEEKKRVQNYLDPSTEQVLVSLLEDELITQNLHAVLDMPNSGLTFMLTNDRFEEISSMFKVIKMVKTGPEVMNNVLCGYFNTQGSLIVEESGSSNSQKYIQDLIQLRDKADYILRECLENQTMFRNKLNSTFEDFINQNSRSPEFLSLFLDDKLRRGTKGMSDQDIDSIFDKCIIVFRYLHEKDVFERYYKQHLAKRLLLAKSQSDDQERSMISKLMVECGSMFTNKFEGMFKDMTISKSLDEEFAKGDPRRNLPIDINVRVLTAGLWPTEKESQKVLLPEEAQKAFEVYSNFYLDKHSGRKITLQTNQGHAELNAVFYGKAAKQSNSSIANQGGEGSAAPGGPGAMDESGKAAKKAGKSYILQVSTYQMVILMKFNKQAQYTFSELANETAIPERELTRSLLALSLGKSSQRILLKEPKVKRIDPTDVFMVNEGFTSDHHRVKVQNISVKETEPERLETRSAVDENRRYVIEATIVRIMKTRKTLEHNILLAEVIDQLKARFQPSPSMIKQRIESLLERNYLARSESDRRIYNYLA